MAALSLALPDELKCFQAHIIPPDDHEHIPPAQSHTNQPVYRHTPGSEEVDSLNSSDLQSSLYNFDVDGIPMVEDDDDIIEQDLQYSNDP
jgi:hypothetical protein